MFQLTNLLKDPIGWLEAKGEHCESVVSSRIRLARNLNLAKFPHRASARELKVISQKIWEAARRLKELARAAFIKLTDLESIDQQFLVERHLISADLLKNPTERSVIVGEREFASLMVNEEDHLRLQMILPGFSLPQALERALCLDQALGEGLSYSFHEEFGFLTSCPTNVGTGLRASALVHLPALVMTQEISSMLQGLSRVGLTARGFYGEGSEVYGDLFQISNATSIGKSEREFISTIVSVIHNVLEHEAKTQERIFKGPQKAKAVDRCWRAYATLIHARLLSFEETMRELSFVRLGLERGFQLDHLTLDKVNELIIISQPAHIQMRAGRELTPQQRDEFRAGVIRKALTSK